MVDKEERFCIFKENFDTNITEIEGPKYMTRSEAVDKMARAIAFKNNITYVSDEQWDFVMNGFRISAEAALDALLGGKNG